MDTPIDLKSMILLLEYQVLEDVNEILCPHTLDQYCRVKTQIISVLENGVEEVELVKEIRARFDFCFLVLLQMIWRRARKKAMQLKKLFQARKQFGHERDSRHGM